LQAQLGEFRQKAAETTAKVAVAAVGKLQQQLAAAQAEAMRFKQQAEETKTAAAADNAQHQKQLEHQQQLDQQLVQAHHENKSLKAQLRELQQQLTAVQAEAMQFRQKTAETTTKVAVHVAAVGELQQQLTAAQAEAMRFKQQAEETTTAAAADNAQHQKQLEQLRQSEHSLTSKLTSATVERDELRAAQQRWEHKYRESVRLAEIAQHELVLGRERIQMAEKQSEMSGRDAGLWMAKWEGTNARMRHWRRVVIVAVWVTSVVLLWSRIVEQVFYKEIYILRHVVPT
jgi:chromosome segregation ATPase